MQIDRRSVPLLAVEDLGVEFRTRSGTVRALEHVGFELRRGETMALVGESGSGKSVTAYAIMGILDAAARVTSGKIVFGGLDLLRADASELAEIRGRELAIIFQNPRTALNPIRPVGRQIADILCATATSTRRAGAARAPIEMLAKVRIPDPERRAAAYPFELSGGMCQRVMIAMALACEPALLIADEPTTGLDVTTQAVIMDLIARTRRAKQHGDAADHARSRARRRILRPHRGDARRPYRRDRADRASCSPRPRHPYTAKLIAATPGAATRARRLAVDPRRAARSAPRRPAPLPLQRALRARGEDCAEPPLPPQRRDAPMVACRHPAMNARSSTSTSCAKLYRSASAAHCPARASAARSSLHAVDGVSFTIGPRRDGRAGRRVRLRQVHPGAAAGPPDRPDRRRDPLRRRRIGAVPARRFGARSASGADPDGVPGCRPTASTRASPRSAPSPTRCSGCAGCRAPRLRRRVDGAGRLVGLPRGTADAFPHQLSGGQKARVGIARAIAVEPRC